MREHAAIVIAALMITSMAFAVSTSNVSATHAPTVEITPTLTKAGELMDFEIKVTNTSGSPIIKVEVTQPTDFTLGDWVGALVAENKVTHAGSITDVKLPAGTGIPLTISDILTLAENTPVTIGKDNAINISAPIMVIVPAGTVIGEDPGPPIVSFIPATTIVELKYDTRVTPSVDPTSLKNPEVDLGTGDMVILPAGTKIELTADTETDLPTGTLAAPIDGKLLGVVIDATLDADTEGKVGPVDIQVTLTLATTCPLATDATGITLPTGDENLLAGAKLGVVLGPEDITHEIHYSGGATLYEDTTAKLVTTRTINLSADDNVRLPPDNVIVAKTTSAPSVILEVGTEVVLPGVTTTVTLTDADLTLPIPSDWKVVGYDKALYDKIKWENANADGKIGPGESLTFSIRTTTAGDDKDYLWTIKTTAADGSVVYRTLMTTVDGTRPTLEVTMEPENVGAGPATIKVEASEKLSNLDNVYVELDENTDRRTLISMTPDAEKKVWTGTVTIPSNGLWDDNKVDIVVLAELTKDMAGNALELNKVVNINDPLGIRHINTVPPLLPADLEMTDTTPFDNEVNQKSQLITGIAQDNIDDTAVPLEGMTVKISVNTTIYETKSFALGAFTKEIDLAEGPNTIKVWVIDEWGNVGPENEQTVFLDSIKPTISMVSVADKSYEDNMPVKDNTPTIALTIKDPGYPATALGIEYEAITVELWPATGELIATLENATPWDKATGRFENTISEELGEGFYRIIVNATDVMDNPNSVTFWFEVDTIAPKMPSLTTSTNPVLDGTSVTEPKVQKKTALVFYGSGLEKSSIVKIYLIDQATGSVISTETTEASATGDFSKSLTLDEGKVIRIEVETIDAASNVSSRSTYGYVMIDATAPSVTLAELPDTTDKTSITISGTVSKDPWEDWSEITLTVQIGTGKVVVPCVGGSYEYSLSLAEGPNTIVVQATDDIGNLSTAATDVVERTITPWMTYAIILVIVALILAAIAIFRKR